MIRAVAVRGWLGARVAGPDSIVLLGITGCAVTSGGAIDGWSRIEVEAVQYRARGYAAMFPAERLTRIGTAAAIPPDEVDRVEVYAVEGIDPAVVVAAQVFWGYVSAPEASGQPKDEGPPPINLYLKDGTPEYPPDECGFFDPEIVDIVHGTLLTPEECR